MTLEGIEEVMSCLKELLHHHLLLSYATLSEGMLTK